MIQQANIEFITLFVYGANGQATWFVGPDTQFTDGTNGTVTFTGPLYQTTGPAFAGAFDPHAVGVRQVGNVTLTLLTLVSGSLSYSVDGVTVVKSIERQNWAVENLTGSFLGAATGTYTGACTSTGYKEEPASLSIAHTTPTAISLNLVTAARNCTYTGTYDQRGRMGDAIGSFTCTNGTTGTFGAVEMQATAFSFTMRITTTASGCGWEGLWAGAKRSS